MKLIDQHLRRMADMPPEAQLVELKKFGYHMGLGRLYAERVRLGLDPRKKAEAWPPEHDADLRKLAEDPDNTFERIAEILNEKYGTKRTKGAVLGRVHRLKITRLSPVKRIRSPLIRRDPKPKNKPVIKPAAFSAEQLEAAFKGVGAPFNERRCRWPLEKVGNEQTYCGCALFQKSYCEHHFNMAYRKT